MSDIPVRFRQEFGGSIEAQLSYMDTSRCDENEVSLNLRGNYGKTATVTIVLYTRAPDAGAWGPPVLRGECEEVFVFELSGTHELHTIYTTYQVATTVSVAEPFLTIGPV